jgi:hypothetical protein
MQWPLQQYSSVLLEPISVSFRSKAKTNNFIPFELPGVFTIQPSRDPEKLQNYAERMITMNQDDLLNLVRTELTRVIVRSAPSPNHLVGGSVSQGHLNTTWSEPRGLNHAACTSWRAVQ